MKKIFKNLLFVVLFVMISILGATSVNAQSKDIEVTDVKIKDKSGTITAEEPTITDGNISSGIKFNEVGDFVTYELTLKNNESDKYKVISITDNNENENIEISYTYAEDYIGKGETSKVTIKLTYKNKLVNQNISLDDLEIKLNLEKEDGTSSQITLNPKTGDNILEYVLLFIASGLGLYFIITKKKIKEFKVGNLLLILAVILIPFAVLANEKFEISLKFTDIEVKGEFEVYNITINPKDGSSITIKDITYGEPIGELPELEKEGYEFIKWVDEDGNEITEDTIITKQIEIEAKYIPIEYTITYNLNGGTATNPDKYTIESNDITLNNPTREGYTFDGWTGTDIDNQTTSVTINKGSTKNKTYTAHYTPIEYTITYNLDGGSLPSGKSNPDKYTIESDDITLENPEKEGYTFTGWTGTGIDTQATTVTINKGSTKNKTYTANYIPIEYTISYSGLTASEKASLKNPTKYTIESNITLKNPEDREDNDGDKTERFVGWQINETISSNITFTNEIGNKEYEAKWETVNPNEYTITYNLNGGETATENKTKFTKFDTFTLVNPEKEGYTFDGWTGSNGETPQISVTVPTGIRHNLNYTANYTPIEYTITYNLNEGSLPIGKTNPNKYTIESDDITLNNPTREGYTFTGWTGTNIDNQSTSVTINNGSIENRTYEAHYLANTNTKYTVIHKYRKLNSEEFDQDEPDIKHGTTDTTVLAPIKHKDGFVDPTVQNVLIKGDESAEVTYEYEREVYSFNITDRTYIETTSSANGTYQYETELTVKAQERAGYTFKWSDNVTDFERTFSIDKNIELTPIYTANQNTKYVVKHYKQKIDLSGYEIEDTQNLTGTTDSEITPSTNTYTGFIAPQAQTTTIKGDGSLVIIYNYDREQYEVSFDTNGGNEVESQTIVYEAKASRPQLVPMKEGYDKYAFDAWYTDTSYETEFDFANTKIEGPTTIYAKMDSCRGFSTDSWTKINNNLVSNPNYYPVGCQKNVSINAPYGGGTFTVRLANTSIPEVCNTEGYSQTACGPVIEFVNTNSARQMHSGHTTAGGWKESQAVVYLNDGFYNGLPGELKSVIIPTYPIVSGNGKNQVSENITSADTNKNKIYYLSGREVGLDLEEDNKKDTLTDTRTLDYYEKNDGNYARKKTTLIGDSVDWWLRTAASTKNEYYHFINGDGNSGLHNSAGTCGNTPAFRIGEGSGLSVSFDTDGGSDIESQLVSYNGYATRPTDPTKESYGFDDWYTDETYATKFDFENTKISDDTTIYARFVYNSYSVKFNTLGGTEIEKQMIESGKNATRPANPELFDREFVDWYTDKTYTTVFDFENTPIEKNTTIYAKYNDLCNGFSTDSWPTIKTNVENNPNHYPLGCRKEVKLDMNNDNKKETYKVRIANTNTPEVCETEGYSQTACGFVLEFEQTLGKRRINPTDTNEGGWIETEMVTYLNGSFYGKLPSDLKEVIIPTYPIVSSYGRDLPNGIDYTSNNITENDIDKNKIYFFSTREVGIDAPYYYDNKNNEETDTRVLDYYNGTAESGSESRRVKKDINGYANYWWLRAAISNDKEKFAAVSRNGALGYQEASGGGAYTYEVSPAFRIAKAKKVTVTFNTNGGSEIESQEMFQGNKVTRPETNPTKTGYEFDDWYEDSQLTTKFDFENTKITENIVIYAKFNPTSFAADDWQSIKTNLTADPEYYLVGSEKEVKLDMDNNGEDESYTVRLANTSTPNECNNSTMSQTGCGIVIEFVTIPVFHRMNASDTISGGWKETEMITYLNGEFYNKLPSDLKDVIIPTYPIVSGSYKNSTSVDITSEDINKNKLYLLSPREIGADSSGQDTRYNDNRTLDYYIGTSSDLMSDEPKRIKKRLSGKEEAWWLRTVRKEIWSKFYAVLPNGLVQYNLSSDQSYGVAPAFRIN